jgi:hypothetical protein
MKLYRLRHRPTGLYFRPARGCRGTNLAERGKVYTTVPSFAFVEQGYRDRNGHDVKHTATQAAREWQMVVYEMEEVRVVPFRA